MQVYFSFAFLYLRTEMELCFLQQLIYTTFLTAAGPDLVKHGGVYKNGLHLHIVSIAGNT